MKHLSNLLLAASLMGLSYDLMAQVPNYVPSNGLVGWWPFNGNANDESGNGNNGQVINSVLTADRNGNPNSAYSFDGSGDYISIPDDISLRPSLISLSCWINQNDTVLTQQLITKRNDSNAANEMFALETNFNFAIKDSSGCNPFQGWVGCSAPNNSLTNTWHHLVATYDGVTFKLYYDAVLIGSNNFSGVIDNCVGGELRFGRAWSQAPLYFNGMMDDIGMWNRALTEQEIFDLFNASSSVGIASSTIDQEWKVFPNPAAGIITVDLGNLTSDMGTVIKIFNSVGQQVFETNVNSRQTIIDQSSWGETGLYFLQLVSRDNNTISTHKLIIE